ncbi:MAG: cation diffusion facilitator family transporter [Planctomycetota bacterium]|jgi:cation diffusion facilitator family transporter
MLQEQKCIKCAARLSWIGIWDSAFLALFKGVIGILTGSRALTASALYSLHDVISGVAVLIGLKVATKPADKEHPYGYGNVEYIVCVFTSILILGATVFLLGDCIRIIFMAEHAPPHWAALAAAVISVAANEIIYRFNICAYKHMNSPALLALWLSWEVHWDTASSTWLLRYSKPGTCFSSASNFFIKAVQG